MAVYRSNPLPDSLVNGPCSLLNMRILIQLLIFAFWSFLRPLLPLVLSGPRGIVVARICPSVRPSVCLSVCNLYLLRMITRHKFEPNHQIYTKHASWHTLSWYWKWMSLILTFKVILPIWLRILGNSACSHDNSSQIWARRQQMYPRILSSGIENGVIDFNLQGHFDHLDLEF